MPCFSASNIRFTGFVDPVNQSEFKCRPNTAAPKPEIPKVVQKDCADYNLRKQYGAIDLNKHAYLLKGQKSRINLRSNQTTLSTKELDRLKVASKVVTLNDRQNALIKKEQESKNLEEEAELTRIRFKEIDEARKKAAGDNVEKEDILGASDRLKVLERAFLAKHEQDEEVKRVNKIILNAKCHAVRDAQVQEQREIEKEKRNEESRLERLVIDRAVKSLNEEDAQFEKEKEGKLKYATAIRKQLKERENIRFLEAERIEEEARMLRKANEAIKNDEERRANLEKERRLNFRKELAQLIEVSNMFKKMLCEQEREADMRISAYMRDRDQRERSLKHEKQIEKEELERKQQRMYALGVKILESRTQREEMSYLREQERIEREYRRKEKEIALRKRQIEKELAEARERQLQEVKHRQALQIARAEQEFNILMQRLKEDELKQSQMGKQQLKRRECYRQDIVRQMNDKEMERRRLEELERVQTLAWRESERQRDANIKTVIAAKLSAMREACLPLKYIRDVEKQLNKISFPKN